MARSVLAAAVLSAAAAAACTPAVYVAQAACGQLDLAARTRPLADAVRDHEQPERVRALLRMLPSIKRYAERNGLTPTTSYDTYADLGRPSAVWVVTASEPLRFRLRTWTFPIVGSVPYLGWFERGDAVVFASLLRDEGWDVDLRGADAYSTLGWFSDPVLSTMMTDGDEALGELSNVVLHESVHATVYVPGQSALNESIASFVADGLTVPYLVEATGRASRESTAYEEAERARAERGAALHETYRALTALYASHAPAAQKLRKKRTLLSELMQRVGARRPINNATLAQFKTYSAGLSELRGLLRACGGSHRRLLRSVAALREGGHRPQESDIGALLSPLVRAGCPG